MTEFDLHSILRAQKDKPVEIDRFDASLFWEIWLLLCIWAWGMGFTYGEAIWQWWTK